MTAGERVSALQRVGWKVYVSHLRPLEWYPDDLFDPEEEGLEFTRLSLDQYRRQPWQTSGAAASAACLKLAPRGGRTVVTLVDRDGVETVAEARCSKLDNFNKKLGLEIALNRALHKEEQG